jgi:hypothetical protein
VNVPFAAPARSHVLVVLSLFAGGLACSTTEPLSGPGSSFATAFCTRLDRCRPRLVRDEFGDVATCRSRLFPDFNDELTSPGTTITTAQIDACTAKMGSTPCSVLTSAIVECNFAGTLAAGAPCGSGYQCQTGSCFRVTSSSGVTALCGTCSARVPLGGDCTTANCEGGLSCTNGRCIANGAEGAACNPDTQPCQAQLQCFNGACVRQLVAGAPCTPVRDGQPDPIFCDPLFFCAPNKNDPNNGTCTAVRHSLLGDECGLDEAAGQLLACAGASCTSATGGRCVADLKEGATCDPARGGCEVPFECLEGRCSRQSITICR